VGRWVEEKRVVFRSWSSGMAVAMVVGVGMGMERPWCAVVGDA